MSPFASPYKAHGGVSLAQAVSSHPPRIARPRIIALMNQKGGVGKTTTTVNLGAALSLHRQRVLLIDLDPQAHLTLHVGLNPDDLDATIYGLMTDPDASAMHLIHEVRHRLYAMPAEVNLAGVDAELAEAAAQGEAQHILRDKVLPMLESLPAEERFDFVLIDCPPSLGLLTINGLALANEVFVPMQTHFLALQGLSKLLSTVSMVGQSLNPELRVTAIVLGLHDGQTVLANEVMSDLESFLEAARGMDVPWRSARVLQPPVRRNIKLAECPSFGKTIYDYAPLCPGAADYRKLAEAVLAM
ncbi:MAG: ParA family protein [Phycisphaeraceae bacterium]